MGGLGGREVTGEEEARSLFEGGKEDAGDEGACRSKLRSARYQQ